MTGMGGALVWMVCTLTQPGSGNIPAAPGTFPLQAGIPIIIHREPAEEAPPPNVAPPIRIVPDTEAPAVTEEAPPPVAVEPQYGGEYVPLIVPSVIVVPEPLAVPVPPAIVGGVGPLGAAAGALPSTSAAPAPGQLSGVPTSSGPTFVNPSPAPATTGAFPPGPAPAPATAGPFPPGPTPAPATSGGFPAGPAPAPSTAGPSF